MLGLDDHIAGLGGGSVALALLAALLLGLRHATDPDHVTALTTLALSEARDGARRAAALGTAWGAGHALTLFVLGMPVVVLGGSIPEAVTTSAELAVGLLIAALAIRLLVRWRRGHLHAHPHSHGGVVHAHPHLHENEPAPHLHEHEHAASAHPHAHEHRHDALGRTPRAAFGIGLVHGVGGSGGAGILLAGAVGGGAAAAAALALFAAGTAASMALVSAAFGAGLGGGSPRRRIATAAPAMGAASLAFGVWYALASVGVVPYAL